MKEKLKRPLRFVLIILPFAVVGGYFTGSYAYDSYAPEIQQQILAQVGSVSALSLISALQSVFYAIVFGLIGYILSERIGLMKPFRFEKQPLLRTCAVTVVLGLLFSLDYWTFGSALPEVASLYESGLLFRSFSNWMASVFYGGMIEEILMRLFLMSLLSFLLWKLFFRRQSRETIPTGVFVAANVLSALLFAAGHLPATVNMFGGLSPLILARCFLFNGVLGLVFGRFYRTYGIQYAMLSHAGCHIISKLIWLIFL
ncbi:MAG: type II CAAX prenyl endopeptidase Rce1 family protein [Butyricicoccaceae bacterium]